MQNPPFRLARASLLGSDSPNHAATTLRPVVRRRATLAELDPHFHCSLIGTCLTTAELRKLVLRLSGNAAREADDIEIHHEAVSLARQGVAGCKAIHKALDERHALSIRRFATARDANEVQAMWRHAQAEGDIPGAYWALMTHPDVTQPVRRVAFGEVHMLSHLVGAANRADIRRLVALEGENAELREKVARQQQRMQLMSAQHAKALQDANEQIAALRGRQARRGQVTDAHAEDLLRTTAQSLSELMNAQAARMAAAEQRAEWARDEAATLRGELDEMKAQLSASRAEAQALEALVAASTHDGAEPVSTMPGLASRRIVYVGGRGVSTTAMKALVERAGGEFQRHDGGLEQRKGLLPAMVAGADVVVFPVDCVDHDSVAVLKRVCQQQGIAYHPVRSASVASFMELAVRLFGRQEKTDADFGVDAARPAHA
ncbi:hypothetical protein LMG26411_05241 [Cupriavidus numazuensis]|uniref:DUF2325 domain-containing protein n=2 Tax=Cupriavidus numazuensis TaxID=221992 RepID=A0ABN7Q6S5_9BURK|nr:hypothetical protein LMG26411_05241 [Cupriavidus numazuensis]